MRFTRDQRGFTLPELVVAVVVVFVLLLGTTLALKPYHSGKELRDAERRTALAEIAQAIRRYEASGLNLRQDITQEDKTIGSAEDALDLCPVLVPDYLKKMPIDPSVGYVVDYETGAKTDDTCDMDTVEYETGYGLRLAPDGVHLIVSAVITETTQKMTLEF